MSIPIKPVIAGTVLCGVAVVWLPKFTSFDPLGLNASAKTPDASGAASLPPGYDLPMPFDDGGVPGDADPAARESDGNALSALGAVLSYLEERDTVRDHGSNTAVAARAVAVEARELRGDAGFGGFGGQAPATVEEFLEQNPLSAIAIGDTRSGALFGRINVEPGDTLLGGTVLVHAIERTGVLLDTDAGRLRVPLPAPGELSPRRERAPQSRDTSGGNADASARSTESKPSSEGGPIRAGEAPSPGSSATTEGGGSTQN